VLLAIAASGAAAEADYLLWVESPGGSDLWSRVRIRRDSYESAEECRRRAQELNDLEATFAKMQEAQAHDIFTCLPDTVDPRPEGALVNEVTTPRPAEGK
jgi:hypothetical protein